ncbi:RNA-directed DNA polymerase, eukaryota [Tanacetum coccineum]
MSVGDVRGQKGMIRGARRMITICKSIGEDRDKDRDSNNEEGNSCDEDGVDGREEDDVRNNRPGDDFGSRNLGEDGGSTFSGETKVSETFKEVIGDSKMKTVEELERTYENYKEKDNGNKNNEDVGNINKVERKHEDNGINLKADTNERVFFYWIMGLLKEREHKNSEFRREKREVLPSSLMGSRGTKSKKKRKSSADMIFDKADVKGVVGLTEEEKKDGMQGSKDIIVDGIGFQQIRVVDDFWIKDIWGGKGYGYFQLPRVGNSRGIVLIWDSRIFISKEAIGDKRFIVVKGDLKGKDDEVFLVCIYGSHVNIKEMIELNDFANDMRLVEIMMWGRKFTRVSDDGVKFSKVNRFLLNDELNNIWGNPLVIALDRKLSDRCLIVLKDVDLDFGPKPFCVFNVWLEPDFYQVVEEAKKK